MPKLVLTTKRATKSSRAKYRIGKPAVRARAGSRESTATTRLSYRVGPIKRLVHKSTKSMDFLQVQIWCCDEREYTTKNWSSCHNYNGFVLKMTQQYVNANVLFTNTKSAFNLAQLVEEDFCKNLRGNFEALLLIWMLAQFASQLNSMCYLCSCVIYAGMIFIWYFTTIFVQGSNGTALLPPSVLESCLIFQIILHFLFKPYFQSVFVYVR